MMTPLKPHNRIVRKPTMIVEDDDPLPNRNPRRGWHVSIDRDLPRVRIPRTVLISALQRIGRAERVSGEITVVITGDKTMRRLNRRFRGHDRQTDVLAFPLESSGDDRFEGEIYCNYDHARRWRDREGETVSAELTRLAVHGCLHLLGYDHHTAAARTRMAAVEDRYLAAEGLIQKRQSKDRSRV